MSQEQAKSEQSAPRGSDGAGDVPLEEQLDALLSQIEREEGAEEHDEGEVGADSQASGEAAASERDESADDGLAQQIQALLDEADTQPGAQDQDAAGDGAGDEADEEPGASEAQENEKLSSMAGLGEGAAQDVAAPGDRSDGEQAGEAEGSMTIDELDDMLADEASAAVEGDFETVSEVLDEVEAGQADEESAAREGDAAEPEGQQAGAVRAGGATAADVAAELDDQPEDGAGQVAGSSEDAIDEEADEEALVAAAVAAEPVEQADSSGGNARGSWRGWLATIEPTTLGACRSLNAPLMKLSPEMRQTVGYIGLVNLITGVCLLLFALL